MPFTAEGIRPDLIINPHAIPTRMTIGQLVECITGKAATMLGGYSDCTAFNNKGSKVGFFGEILSKQGFHSSGNELLYNGMTGEQLESEIFMGPTYYMRLKHMVKDKINFRAQGPRTALTRQPVSGRANDGGLRIGEMERDSVISHGAAAFLNESMMERGDKYYMAVCNNTGMIAVYNPDKNLFLSPMADGPLRFVGSLDGKEMNIETFSVYGRNFSVICVPYSLKLLIQELQTINVQMRVITEDNIEQLTNMSFSKNIEKLSNIPDITAPIVRDEINKILKQKGNSEIVNKPYSPKDEMHTPTFGSPSSPAFVPERSLNDNNSGSDSPQYHAYTPPPKGEEGEFKPVSPEGLPPEPKKETPWVKAYSDTYQRDYWFNTVTGAKSWTEPPELSQTTKELFSGGGLGPTFNLNDKVLFRGDLLPNRLWTITHIGDHFMKIEAINTEGLLPSDTVKIVSEHDIYKPEDYYKFQKKQQQEFVQLPGPLNVPFNAPFNGPFNGMAMPTINIAPSFKMVGQNDYLLEPAMPQVDIQSMSSPNPATISSSPIVMELSSQNVPLKDEVDHNTKSIIVKKL
uniref:DNA-directed RNA polymerase n=1 Tax=viral metagenome TaxID=1070528 RepID=A0A6C0I3A3_9ZZZZ